MKKILLSLAMVAVSAICAMAATATFDFTVNGAYGIAAPTTASSGTDFAPGAVLTEGDVTATLGGFDATTSNKPRIWMTTKNALEFRAYTGQTMTIKCDEAMKSIKFTGGKTAKITASAGTQAGADWSGDATEVTFTFGATVNITTIEVTYGSNVAPVAGTLWAEDFSTSLGDFTTDNVSLAEGLTKVWSFASGYGAKATAYVGGKDYAAESWLISPVLDLANATEPVFSFDHATNFFSSVDVLPTEAKVAVRVEGGAWTALNVAYPASMSWTFVTSGDIDLAAYAGKKIQLGFCYTSTTKAGTWEVKNLKISGKGSITVADTPVPPVEIKKVADIKAFLDLKSTDAVEFSNSVTAVAQVGNYLFVQDASGSILVYGKLDQTYAMGDVIPAGFQGVYAEYNQAPQLASPAKFAASTSKAEVTCEEMNLEDLSTDLANTYVKLTGVNIVADGANYNVEQDGLSYQLYNRFSIDLAEGENLNITGIVSNFKGAIQFYPMEITDASGEQLDPVAAVTFSVASGKVAAGTEVALACATEGAKIYYTINGENPTEASHLYSTPIAILEPMTIKAMAVKEGMRNSAVASATYTIQIEVTPSTGGTATFDFTDPTQLTPYFSIAHPEADADGNLPDPVAEGMQKDGKNGYYYNVSDETFVNNGVTITVTKGTSTDARLYWSKTADMWSLRAYKGSTVEFTVTGEYKIDAIAFEGNNVKNIGGAEANWEGTAKEGIFNVTEDRAQVVSFPANTAGTATLNKVTVTLSDLSGIEAVAAENAAAPVEFFNLQGVRVANPENGLYIRRQGNKVEKVVIR